MTPNRFLETAAALVEGGYAIIPLHYGEKRPQGEGWSETVTTLESLETWPQKGNLGILTAHTPAVDLDITDEPMALAMEAWITEHCGEAPVRVGRAPKRLLVFRANNPFRKIASRFWTDKDGNDHRVEILGQGQQFVAYGLHPDTKAPYRWTQDDLRGLAVDDLPLIDVETATAIVNEFERRAEAAGWTPKGKRANGHAVASDEDDGDLWFLRPKPEVTDEEMREAIALYPNPGRDYDLWVRVGMALHHQYAGAKVGLKMWHDWSERSPLYDHDATETKWESFGNYKGRVATVGWILGETHAARKAAAVQREAAERTGARDRVRAAIDAATTTHELIDTVLPLIAAGEYDEPSRDTLLRHLHKRHKTLDSVAPGLATLRRTMERLREKHSAKRVADNVLRLEYDLAGVVLERYYRGGDTLMCFSNLWWHYREGLWQRTEESIVRQNVQATLLDLDHDGDERLKALADSTVESRGDRLSAIVNTIFHTLSSRVAQDGADDPLDLNADHVERIVNTHNVELWFSNDGRMKVLPHDPAHRLTRQIACEYDPKAACPTWDAAIRRVFKGCKDPESVIRHFEEVFGYILQPTRHQAIWVMLQGRGGNGKTFLLQVIEHVMGKGAVRHQSFSEIGRQGDSHFTDSLQGKLMLLDDDLASGTLLADDWLKRLSEAKAVTANPKYGRPYNFTARCVPVILSNHWPSTTDLSDGLRRRAMIFASDHKLGEDEKDPRHMQAIVADELPGVLNRLLAGLQRYLARGQRFEPPAECEAAKEAWIVSSNPTALFVSLALEKTGNRSDHLPAATLYDIYSSWIRLWEHNLKPLSRTKFYEAVWKLGVNRVNHSGSWAFSGVKLKKIDGLDQVFSAISENNSIL